MSLELWSVLHLCLSVQWGHLKLLEWFYTSEQFCPLWLENFVVSLSVLDSWSFGYSFNISLFPFLVDLLFLKHSLFDPLNFFLVRMSMSLLLSNIWDVYVWLVYYFNLVWHCFFLFFLQIVHLYFIFVFTFFLMFRYISIVCWYASVTFVTPCLVLVTLVRAFILSLSTLIFTMDSSIYSLIRTISTVLLSMLPSSVDLCLVILQDNFPGGHLLHLGFLFSIISARLSPYLF